MRTKNYVVEEDFEYKGFQCCVILQYLGHRCGYVNVGKTSLKGKYYNDIGIWCHGGITYSSQTLVGHEESPDDWWIGWDYEHYGDANDYKSLLREFADNEKVIVNYHKMKSLGLLMSDGHIYSQHEVKRECMDVVEQLLESGDKE